VKSLAGDQLKADEIPSLEEVYKDAKIEIEDFISEEIHLDTGWPIEWFFTRRTLIEMEGKSMNQLIKRSVSMLFEDDEE
jgi:Zn-dependent alcohol dehydrogenase